MTDTRLPECVVFVDLVGGTGCVGWQEKEWIRCFLDDLGAFGTNTVQWTTAAQGEEKWCRGRSTTGEGGDVTHLSPFWEGMTRKLPLSGTY